MRTLSQSVCVLVSRWSTMSRDQVSISELLLSLDSSELQEAEQVRAAVNQQLSSGESVCSPDTCLCLRLSILHPSVSVYVYLSFSTRLSLSVFTCPHLSPPVCLHLILVLSGFHLSLPSLSVSTCMSTSLLLSVSFPFRCFALWVV